ncbi:uncharacterized protein LOC100570234 isoform X2 [Acyrthosiphon pisum]|uniref:Uncharacterized protein n=1 Tax=Acyrthosiphon pisum TaxID=7029 RepID=A0A8R2H3B5_ACYPI|nr:uncharacterized protein LOC100570234 isoform X2 [Acyrthosiphon pisum]|eukprot:XP_016657694.1 PREDICTED: uncharacterized protein LOC100570234 [Acyrthosiphon pisum]
MVKHIIMLTLFLMIYIIGNIDALNEAERKGRQMFENGLIKAKTDQSYKVETGFDENGEIVPTANNIQFENDEALDSFRSEFFKDFVQKGNQEEFQAQIDDLNEKRKKDEFFVCKLFSSMIYNNYNSILMPL